MLALGADRVRQYFVREVLDPAPGTRLLDIACGTGDMVPYLPPGVRYYGFDRNEAYIRSARLRFGQAFEFGCESIESVVLAPAAFDLAIAVGILHHLDDHCARTLLSKVHAALAPGGHLVCVDGTLQENQSVAARFIVGLDRGRFVRSPEQYVALASCLFEAKVMVRHDLLRIPYTHAFLQCTKAKSPHAGMLSDCSSERRAENCQVFADRSRPT
jgi:SAM-dependent methyltransferase